MARLHPEVIEALRSTARRLQDGAPYQWGHAGACNCGHLAQTVTSHNKAEIYRMVQGEWSEHLNAYCPETGASVEEVSAQMMRFGFGATELADLEWLSGREILKRIPEGERLRRNRREDVVRYLDAWADLLEERMEQSRAERDERPSRVAPRSAIKKPVLA